MKKEKLYEAPVVEIIEVEVEKGFATSPGLNTQDEEGMGVGVGSY